MRHHPTPADRIRCNQDLVVMGNSYGGPPDEWRTRQASCQSCRTGFTVTAEEQRFWYEDLRIPYVVSINRCPDCRKRQRNHRRIIGSLSELIPLIDRGDADRRQQRDAVLTIAEGMISRLATPRKLDIPILSGTSIAERCAAIIADLRTASAAQDDLIPIAIMAHQKLENQRRAERLTDELQAARQRSVPMDRAIRTMQDWLRSPSKLLRERIADPPRG